MADALDTMRKAMALHENVAAVEQKKGELADLRLIADAMGKAADLARDIATIEDRRGITDAQAMPDKFEVYLTRTIEVCPCCKFERTVGGIRETLAEASARAKKRAAAQLLLPGPKTAAKPSRDDDGLPLIDVTPGGPPRTDSVHDEGSYATERGAGTHNGGVLW